MEYKITGEDYRIVSEVVNKWWDMEPGFVRSWLIKKTCFHLELLFSKVPRGSLICDIGGGWGCFAASASALGMKSILIDDYEDAGFKKKDKRFDLLDYYNVKSVNKDIVKGNLEFKSNSIDAFTSFDVLEHLHSSPKKMLHEIMEALKPGGYLIIGVPNCVSLRKRLTVPFGYGKWSSMDSWYENDNFRSHVREPDVSDLLYIANDLGLKNSNIIGANMEGYRKNNRLVRGFTMILDPIVRLRPSLCSGIFLVGQKL